MPGPVSIPTSSTPSRGTVIDCHCGTGASSSVTPTGAPVTHTRPPSGNFNAGPPLVHSSPAMPSGFASTRCGRANPARWSASRAAPHRWRSLSRDHHPPRGGVESVAGVVDLRTVGHQHQRVALGAKRQRLPRRGEPVDDPQCAVGLDRHVHEEVDVRHDVALAQSPFGALGQKVLGTSVLMHGVMAVAQRVGLLRARPGDRVVVADVVGDDRHQRSAVGGAQHRAGAQEDVALHGDGGLRAVAERVIDPVPRDAVQQRVDRLIAEQVDDLHRLACADDRRPRRARSDHLVADDGQFCRRHWNASLVCAAAQVLSVLNRARKYSGSLLTGVVSCSPARQASTSRPVSAGSGSSGWAALTSATVTGRWISRSTAAPGPAEPVKPSVPSSSTRTPLNNDTDGPTSRISRPCLMAANSILARPASVMPHKVSWWPELSATTVASTRPWSDSSGWPARRYACHGTFMVSATLSRSHGASERNRSRCAHAPPSGSISRRRVPRPSTLVAYDPAGTDSAHIRREGSTSGGVAGIRMVAACT